MWRVGTTLFKTYNTLAKETITLSDLPQFFGGKVKDLSALLMVSIRSASKFMESVLDGQEAVVDFYAIWHLN